MLVRLGSSRDFINILLEKGMSVAELARHCAVAVPTIQKVLVDAPINFKAASKIFKALNRDGRLKIWLDVPKAADSTTTA